MKDKRAKTKRKYQRRSSVTNTGRQALKEPQPSTRLEQIRQALSKIEFGFTIFFANERGESIKYYQGAVVQQNDPR